MEFGYKIVCIDNRFSKPTVVFRGENAAYKLIKAILKEYEYFKKVMKKHFNKNLIMCEEEDNSCWICEKLIHHNNEKLEIIVT